MAKQQDYGFKTPKRRETKNITGFKVGGDLTGRECKILKSNQIVVQRELKQSITLSVEGATQLFQSDLAIFAIGGYFYSNDDFHITFEISYNGKTIKNERYTESKNFIKMGLDFSMPFSSIDRNDNISATISIKSKSEIILNYLLFDSNFIDYDYFQKNDVSAQYNNSKKWICYPEQFYGNGSFEFEGSQEGIPFVLKSCNRCNRYLPINPFDEKQQLSFNNHKRFVKYIVKENEFSREETNIFFKQIDMSYEIVENKEGLVEESVISVLGHQLECRACKKFYVNSDLNKKRSSTQRREDGLRRRFFEPLIRELLGIKSIYHTFDKKQHDGKEFDEFIWEKFDKKCFKCEIDLESPKKMDLDHTMPLSYLYPLDETATCLCKVCNGEKNDKFPIQFYTNKKLLELAQKTGLNISILQSVYSNQEVVNKIKENLIWLIDEFLAKSQYQKEVEGKKVSDLILKALQKAINASVSPFNIEAEYKKAKSIQ